MDLYYASAKDLETVCCFLDFHETNESPRKTQSPVTDLLVLGHDAESAFAKALRCNSEVVENKIPYPGVAFRYCRTLFAARR